VPLEKQVAEKLISADGVAWRSRGATLSANQRRASVFVANPD
jgi:hypothetical protein